MSINEHIALALHKVDAAKDMTRAGMRSMLDDIGLILHSMKQDAENDHHAAEYYRCAVIQRTKNEFPQFVPHEIVLKSPAYGDGPFRSTVATIGKYIADCNKFGAVSVKASNGQMLGLRLDEFTVLSWRNNDKLKVQE